MELKIDPKKLELWEMETLESGKFSGIMLVFCRYMATNGALLSPDLPYKPLDEMTQKELEDLKESLAYKAIKRVKLPDLRQATNEVVASFNTMFQ